MRYYRRPDPLPDVLEEFLEEAAWLYESRCRTLVDPELGWQDLADLDARLLPHLRGLALGGAGSAELLRDKLLPGEDDEPFEAFVAAAVLPMLPLVEPATWLADALASDPPHFAALVDGLKLSGAASLPGWLADFLRDERPGPRRAAAEVAGYRRMQSLVPDLRAVAADPDPTLALTGTSALVELGQPVDAALPAAVFALESPDLLCRATELSLLLEGSRGLERCRARVAEAEPGLASRLLPYLAAAGDHDDAGRIAGLAEHHPEIAPDALVALGLAGSPAHAPRLLEALESVEPWETFCAGFQGLRFLSDRDALPEFDPDEADEAEIAAYRAQWSDWWAQEGSRLDPARKWRRGKPLSPASLVEDLERSGNPLRHFTQLEARLRFGSPVAVQWDAFVATQREQIEQARSWAESAPQSGGPPQGGLHAAR